MGSVLIPAPSYKPYSGRSDVYLPSLFGYFTMANVVEQLSDHGSYPNSEKRRAPVNVTELNERRRAALAEIDNAPFSYALFPSFFVPSHLPHSWFHVKVCLVAGVGFFTDA